jgi:phosphoglycolate phosphatase
MANPSEKTHLFLFDIDGTLITSGGAGEHALKLAIHDHFGVAVGEALAGIEIAGRTDKRITQTVFEKFGGGEFDAAKVTQFLDTYLGYLSVQLPQKEGRLLPGIIDLLDALKAKEGVSLALLTGNLERGAELKLAHYGVWHYFEFGAYADDSADRNQLGPVAQARAREKHGIEFPPERIFILGDTEHDIACGRAIGAKTVAIATGNFSSEELARHQPDFLYEDLSNVEAVLCDLFA